MHKDMDSHGHFLGYLSVHLGQSGRPNGLGGFARTPVYGVDLNVEQAVVLLPLCVGWRLRHWLSILNCAPATRYWGSESAQNSDRKDDKALPLHSLDDEFNIKLFFGCLSK